MPCKPWARELFLARQANLGLHDPHPRCSGNGGPRTFDTPYGIDFVQDAGRQRILILIGWSRRWREIHMDGRPHPDLETYTPTFFGHSVGHWEDDTLVIDTVGFNERFWFTRKPMGMVHTESLHLVERISRPDYRSEMEPRGREGFSAHFVSAATIRMLRAEVAAGTSTTHHNHPDEEMVYVVEGRIRVFSGGNEVELGAGELVVFPAYVDHHYEAIEDSMTIEVFGPGRTFGAPAGMGMGGQGYARMKLSRFGMTTAGRVCASIASSSAMIPFRYSR